MSSEIQLSDIDGVIVISVTELPPEHTIKKILAVDDLPSPTICDGSIKGYEWKLDTKYYSANVTLFSVQEATIFSGDFCESIQATIFHFNGSEPSSFENVLNWMPSLKDISSNVQLLVCDSCGNNEIHRKKILNWCVENQFELVEINPPQESDEEEEDDGLFSQSKGFGRVISALQANTWSNLTMKEEVKYSNPVEVNKKVDSDTDISVAAANNSPMKKMTVDNEEVLLEEQWLQKVLEDDDQDGESFEALFSKFASMKEKASGLNGEERKKYAEKVAIAFWKAMGGEEEEIAGLDDD